MKKVFAASLRAIFAIFTLAAFALAGCDKTPTGEIPDDDEGGDTPTPSPTESLFEFSVSNITATGAYVTVRAKDPQMYFIFNVVSAYQLETTYAGDPLLTLDNYLRTWVKPRIGYYFEWEDFLARGERNNSSQYADVMFAESEYLVYAAGMDLNGNVITEVETYKFTTAEPKMSDNLFIVRENLGVVTVIPSNNDRYLLEVFTKSEIADILNDDHKLAVHVMNSYGGGISENIHSGEVSVDYSKKVVFFGEYVAVVFGYDGAETTPVTVKEFYFSGSDRSKLTSLTGDYEFNITEDTGGGQLQIVRYGNFYQNGGDNWWFYAQNAYGDYFATELVTRETSGKLPEGEWEIDRDGLYTYPVGVAYGGVVTEYSDGTDDYYGTWVDVLEYNNFSGQYDLRCMAPADSGKVKLKIDSQHWSDFYKMNIYVYDFQIDFKDPKGNNVKCRIKDCDGIFFTSSDEFVPFGSGSVTEVSPTAVCCSEFSTIMRHTIRERIRTEAFARMQERAARK